MKRVEEKAYAKINLKLNVVGRREDGYHDIQSVMHSLKLCDNVTVEQTEGSGVTVTADVDTIPLNDDNLVVAAVKAFEAKTGVDVGGLHINIEKKIPVEAGLGGGSSDAAATLRALNQIYETNLSEDELAEIGVEVGSDVPFCVFGGCACVDGRGDLVVPVNPMPECAIVICKPSLSLSTKKMYGRLDKTGHAVRKDGTAGILLALQWENLIAMSERVDNAFEDVLLKNEKTTVDLIKDTMKNFDALGASMTGTGPAVYGIFENDLYARVAAETLEQQLASIYPEVIVTAPLR